MTSEAEDGFRGDFPLVLLVGDARCQILPRRPGTDDAGVRRSDLGLYTPAYSKRSDERRGSIVVVSSRRMERFGRGLFNSTFATLVMAAPAISGMGTELNMLEG